jgi:predicted component of type VI protein secretion system
MAVSGWQLTVRQGPRTGQTFELSKPVVTIGREAGSDIVLEDPQVSRHHARLTQQGAGYVVEDLGSTNGSFINGRRVMASTPLNPGDKLGLGDTVVLEVQGGSGAAETMVGAPMAQPVTPPTFAPAVSAPPPAFGAPPPPPPPPQKKGPSCWLWGCGCLVLLLAAIVVAVALIYFLAPPSIAGPICDALGQAGLGSLCK